MPEQPGVTLGKPFRIKFGQVYQGQKKKQFQGKFGVKRKTTKIVGALWKKMGDQVTRDIKKALWTFFL